MDPLDLITKNKIKRYFRATRKLNAPNIVSHITQRAAGREPLFLEETDYLIMLSLMKEISKNYELNIFAFCLMPNHIHFLLSQGQKNLYDAMRDLFSRYAMKFNRKYERKGHLFGGPYRQAICMDETYLLAASIYIHLNPVKAGLSTEPLAYRWSSCRLYSEDNSPNAFIDPAFILGLLSENIVERKARYRKLLNKGGELKTDHVLEQEDSIERFRLKLASIFPSLFNRVKKKGLLSGLLGIDFLSFEELERQIEAVKKGHFSNKPDSRKAKKYLIEQLIARGFKRKEIAQRLEISPKTIYNYMKSRS